MNHEYCFMQAKGGGPRQLSQGGAYYGTKGYKILLIGSLIFLEKVALWIAPRFTEFSRVANSVRGLTHQPHSARSYPRHACPLYVAVFMRLNEYVHAAPLLA
jgi:hypothetical protein